MQKSNLIGLKTSNWPQALSGMLYFLSLFVVMAMPLALIQKLVIVVVISGYLLWWFWRERGTRVAQVTLLEEEQTWLLTLTSGEVEEASLNSYAKLGGWALLHFKIRGARYPSVLITSHTVSRDTFRRLLVYLNFDLTC